MPLPATANRRNYLYRAFAGVWCVISRVLCPRCNGQSVSVKDGSTFLIVVYSAKHGYQRLGYAHNTSSLFDRILQDTTAYFFAIFTWHLLLIFFELFESVSDRSAHLCSSPYYEPHTGNNPTSPCEVSHHLGY